MYYRKLDDNSELNPILHVREVIVCQVKIVNQYLIVLLCSPTHMQPARATDCNDRHHRRRRPRFSSAWYCCRVLTSICAFSCDQRWEPCLEQLIVYLVCPKCTKSNSAFIGRTGRVVPWEKKIPHLRRTLNLGTSCRGWMILLMLKREFRGTPPTTFNLWVVNAVAFAFETGRRQLRRTVHTERRFRRDFQRFYFILFGQK